MARIRKEGQHMVKGIYKVCKKLRQMKLLPWFVWSFVYDHLDGKLAHGEQW